MLSSTPSHLSIEDVAQSTNLSTRTVRRRIADGTIPAVRVGRRILIPADALLTIGRPLTVAKAAR